MNSETATLCPNDALNMALCALVPGAMLFLLALASHLAWWWSPLIGIVFSLLMLTNYALMHEAAHGYLHSRPLPNTLLGTFTGMHFPMSGRFFRLTHQVHHRCNRTDASGGIGLLGGLLLMVIARRLRKS